jgi:hypothetical protein
MAVHRHVGAEISRGGRGAPDAVARAAALLREKHKALPASLKKRMESYLSLEMGVSLLHAGTPVSGAHALAKSWLLHPRFQASLEPFWERG